VVVKGKGGDENTEKGSVHDTKHGTQNGAISDHTICKDESIITSDMEGAR